ncbi:hypothetical protein [Stackebrandtia soli]|uniref:hypothetical protein n=1 Tax=Stackebrandtia soli TaxID=1892856 RepID=UPI0039E7CB27
MTTGPSVEVAQTIRAKLTHKTVEDLESLRAWTGYGTVDIVNRAIQMAADLECERRAGAAFAAKRNGEWQSLIILDPVRSGYTPPE